MSDTPTFGRCPLLPCGRSDASCCCMLSKACSGLGLGHAAVLLRKLRRLDDGLVLGELMAICGVQRYASCLCLHLVLPPAGRAVDAVLKHTSPGPAGKHVHPCSLSGDYTSLHVMRQRVTCVSPFFPLLPGQCAWAAPPRLADAGGLPSVSCIPAWYGWLHLGGFHASVQ